MNNEIKIKQLLNRLLIYRGNTELNKWQPEDILTIEDVWILLDYITNLQEENEYFSYCDKELRNKIKNFEYKANNLEEENKEQRNIIVKQNDIIKGAIEHIKLYSNCSGSFIDDKFVIENLEKTNKRR